MIGYEIKKSWGYYRVLINNAQCRIKHMVVLPNGYISMQFHMLRDELWFIASGNPIINLCHVEYVASPGDYFHIKCGEPHKLINNTNEKIELIEIQAGTSIETDTCYLENSYNKIKSGPV
jgi:mannose-6-phosphate isomerase-like protein (cupin superfamily)